MSRDVTFTVDKTIRSIEGIIIYDNDRYIGSIETPDGTIRKKCVKAGPLVNWMQDWASMRNIHITVTIWIQPEKNDK